MTTFAQIGSYQGATFFYNVHLQEFGFHSNTVEFQRIYSGLNQVKPYFITVMSSVYSLSTVLVSNISFCKYL